MTREEKQNAIQQEALSSWKLAGKKGLLAMGTGTGKSKVALNRVHELFAIYGKNLRVLLAVPTEKLRDENWPEEADKWNMKPIYKECVEGYCYVSLPKRPSGHYHLVILDEAHRSTEYNQQVFGNITYDELMMLSATPPKDPIKQMILDQLGPVVFHYSLDQGVKDGIVKDFEIVVVAVRPDNTIKDVEKGRVGAKYKITERANYTSIAKLLTKLRIEIDDLSKSNLVLSMTAQTPAELNKLAKEEKKLKSKRKWYETKTFERNRIIYNSRAKQAVTEEILSHLYNRGRTLVFAGSIAQANILASSTGWMYHSKSDDLYLKLFKAKKINYLIVVNAMNEGQNLPDVDNALIEQVSANDRDLVQRIGRIVRMGGKNKKGLVFIVVLADTTDVKWLRSAVEDIDESKITVIDSGGIAKWMTNWDVQ